MAKPANRGLVDGDIIKYTFWEEGESHLTCPLNQRSEVTTVLVGIVTWQSSWLRTPVLEPFEWQTGILPLHNSMPIYFQQLKLIHRHLLAYTLCSQPIKWAYLYSISITMTLMSTHKNCLVGGMPLWSPLAIYGEISGWVWIYEHESESVISVKGFSCLQKRCCINAIIKGLFVSVPVRTGFDISSPVRLHLSVLCAIPHLLAMTHPSNNYLYYSSE